jgi:hypothetical protein
LSAPLKPQQHAENFCRGLSLGFDVPQVVAAIMADGQIFLVAVAAFAERLNVL